MSDPADTDSPDNTDHADDITVHIPVGMAPLTGGLRQVAVRGATVRQVVQALDARYPGFADSLLSDDRQRLRPGLSIAVNSEVQAIGLIAQVPPGAEIHILPAMAGGAPPKPTRPDRPLHCPLRRNPLRRLHNRLIPRKESPP